MCSWETLECSESPLSWVPWFVLRWWVNQKKKKVGCWFPNLFHRGHSLDSSMQMMSLLLFLSIVDHFFLLYTLNPWSLRSLLWWHNCDHISWVVPAARWSAVNSEAVNPCVHLMSLYFQRIWWSNPGMSFPGTPNRT